MASTDLGPTSSPARALSELPPNRRAEAMARFAVLRPHLEDEAALTVAARAGGVPLRTAQRWLARYRQDGLIGLARHRRIDAGHRRVEPALVDLIEGLALRRPRPTLTAIRRRAAEAAAARGWVAPAASTIHAIVRALDPAMVTLAQEGPAAFRDRYEMVHRHRAERPNAIWQCDHTELDIHVTGSDGRPVRPWLTVVMDDHSRAVAGYTVFTGAPSALNLSLALRQAIWRKDDPAWAVCGVPDVLYVDHGSDFTSTHLEQVAADLRIRLVFSAVGRPQGRGKIERLFGTLNTELLADLPGHLEHGHPRTPPRLTLPELDAVIGTFVVGTYNARTHSETGTAPRTAWIADGWLPRMPDRLEDLDELLVMVAKARRVHRDGIRFQGLRYTDPTLAAYVGEHIAIRYDPRDIAELRVFHHGRFLCRAVSADHAGRTVTLGDVQAARRAHRRALRSTINQKIARVADFLPDPPRPSEPPTNEAQEAPRRPRLRLYHEED